MEYGKKITQESYHQGKCVVTKVTLVTTHAITDRTELLSEIMSAIEMLSDKTDELTLRIKNDKNHKISRIYKEYELLQNQ